jgi:hypothetical protein
MSERGSLEETIPPACQQDPYEFEEWLAGRSVIERSAVTLGVLASLGHASMQRWKEHHAFSIGLRRSLDEFPEGIYAFYFMPVESKPPADALPEELDPPDLEVLGEAAGLDAEEMAEMDDDELSEFIADQLGAELLGEDGDGCYKLAEAPSLHDLLRTMADRGLLGIDPDPWLTDDQPWPKGAGGDSPLSAIRDRHLRRIASGLSGDGWQMFRTDDEEEADEDEVEGCQRPLLRRPDCEFIIGWFSLPPAELGQACILYRGSTSEVEDAIPEA